jgi:hypothetical protein
VQSQKLLDHFPRATCELVSGAAVVAVWCFAAVVVFAAIV